mmetsp:Transcript_12581/g.34293  ORF Transcript_12581/g.34293 Transcript_12581/m.34293 type:complete len:237 (-) Transcript_12581:837-1547(-)
MGLVICHGLDLRVDRRRHARRLAGPQVVSICDRVRRDLHCHPTLEVDHGIRDRGRVRGVEAVVRGGEEAQEVGLGQPVKDHQLHVLHHGRDLVGVLHPPPQRFLEGDGMLHAVQWVRNVEALIAQRDAEEDQPVAPVCARQLGVETVAEEAAILLAHGLKRERQRLRQVVEECELQKLCHEGLAVLRPRLQVVGLRHAQLRLEAGALHDAASDQHRSHHVWLHVSTLEDRALRGSD